MKYSSRIKRNKLLIYQISWMDLKIIMLNEISPTKKVYMILVYKTPENAN